MVMKSGGMIVYIRYIGDNSILATLSSGLVAITRLEGGTVGGEKNGTPSSNNQLPQVTTKNNNSDKYNKRNKKISIALGDRVRYGADGAPKNAGPSPCARPAPLNGLGRGVFFGIPCPCPRSGPRPTHTPDRSPLKMGRNKRGPSRE